MRLPGKIEPGSGGGHFTGQPHCLANSGSSPALYLILGFLPFAVETFFIPAAFGRASTALLLAVLFGVKLAAAGVADDASAFNAGFTAGGPAFLSSAQPARVCEKVSKAGKSNTAFRMERETREYFTKCSLKEFGISSEDINLYAASVSNKSGVQAEG
jgi:hypothetical protein